VADALRDERRALTQWYNSVREFSQNPDLSKRGSAYAPNRRIAQRHPKITKQGGLARTHQLLE
jgi:hypothetical protein